MAIARNTTSRAVQVGPYLSTDGSSMSSYNGTGCKQVLSDCNYISYLTVQTALYLYVIPPDPVPSCITIMYQHEIIYGPVPT